MQFVDKKKVKHQEVLQPVVEAGTPKKEVRLPYYVNVLESPYVVKREPAKTKVIYQTPTNANTAIYDQMLTIDDYKKVLSMLQKEQETKPQYSNNTKTEEKRIEEDNEKKLSELMELYRSV